jgi:hypothetical protein
LLAVNVENNGTLAAVYVSGGAVLASRVSDGTLLWKTPDVGITYLVTANDLDGDGRVDVIAQTVHQIYVIASASGTIEWIESPTDLGTLGDVRVADLSGDGLADIMVEECGCCAVDNGRTGYVYSFKSGFGSPSLLWTTPTVSCSGGGRTTVAFDPTGTGSLDLTLGTMTAISLFDGATGTFLGATSALPSWSMRSACIPANIDNLPGNELVCVFNNTDTTSGDGHEVFALKYQSGATPALATLWSVPVGAVDGELAYGPGLVSDLDGDGSLEISISGQEVDGTSTLTILDALTGSVLATQPDNAAVGAQSLETATTSIVIGVDAQRVLHGWAFDRSGMPNLQQHWSLTGRQALTYYDAPTSALYTIASRFVASDFNGDGLPDLLTTTPSGSGATIEANSGAGSSLQVVASFTRSDSDSSAWIEPGMDRSYAQLVTFWSGGELLVYDSSMIPTYAPGVAIGGFYSNAAWGTLSQFPVVAPLGASGDSVLVGDSAGRLARLDAATASLAVPPVPVWTSVGTTSPSIVAGLDGTAAGIACITVAQPPTTPPAQSITVLHANGAVKWSSPVEAPVFQDPVPASLNSDGVPDLVFQWGFETDDLVQTRGLSGVDGTRLWDASPIGPGPNRNPAGLATFDWNGDGIDDSIFQEYGTRVLSGVDGSPLVSGGPADAYYMPIVSSLAGTTGTSVTLQGGQSPARTYGQDLSTALFTPADNVDSFPYGALATCPGLPPRLVEGSESSPSRIRITDLSGSTAGTASNFYLSGGQLYTTLAAAMSAGTRLGQLTSASLHVNLTGKGRPTAVFGDDDGYLYAVDPCGESLDFSVPFGAPVGAAVFGDTDGDKLDEIIVSVADGYLYDLKQAPIDAPSFVWDIDLPHGIINHDVDTIETKDTLYGLWAAVPGAMSYEVAVVTGSPPAIISSPSWQDAGTSTRTAVTNLTLHAGQKYYFAVRAAVASGVSPDAVSNGVVVIGADGGTDEGGTDAGVEGGNDSGAPDANRDGMSSESGVDAAVEAASPEGGGCGCRASPRGVGDAMCSSLALAFACVIRRRRAQAK